METPRESREHQWKLHLKPNAASIRILTLDGYGYYPLNQSREELTVLRGGIRGIAELQILQQIEQALGGIAIQCFFDLIVGTR
jgi:patatin-like phospholipase/acyl hydrolase